MVQETQTIHRSQPTSSDLAYRQQLYRAVQVRPFSNAFFIPIIKFTFKN